MLLTFKIIEVGMAWPSIRTRNGRRVQKFVEIFGRDVLFLLFACVIYICVCVCMYFKIKKALGLDNPARCFIWMRSMRC